MLQLIDKTGMALLNAMVREIDRRKDKDLPYGDNIRALMEFLECKVPGIAKGIYANNLWERFQQRYNEPNRDRRKFYGMACRDLFEQAILDELFKFGYWEEQEDGYTIQVKKSNSQYMVSVNRPDHSVSASTEYQFPWEALNGISVFEALFEMS